MALHQRCYQRGQLILQFEHYLPTQARKPHAASHAAFVRHMPAIHATIRDYLCHGRRDGYRDFAAVLLLHRGFPAEAVAEAAQEAYKRRCLEAAAVRQLLLNRTVAQQSVAVKVPERLATVTVEMPDLRNTTGYWWR